MCLEEHEFGSREEALLWVTNNQLGRRNLSDYNRTLLIGKKYELEKKIGGRPATAKLDQIDHVSEGSTREKVASKLNISPAAVQRSADLYKAHEDIKKRSPKARAGLEE